MSAGDPGYMAILGLMGGAGFTYMVLTLQQARRAPRVLWLTLRQHGHPDQRIHVEIRGAEPALFLYLREGEIRVSRELIEEADRG